jgi:hypothetical protein
MEMAELLAGNRYGLEGVGWLGRHLGPGAVLSVAAPLGYIRGHAAPQHPGWQKASGCYGAWVGNSVNGRKHSPPVHLRDYQPCHTPGYVTANKDVAEKNGLDNQR